MRRLILLIALLGAAAGMLGGATPAQASATCTIAAEGIDSWSVQIDQIHHLWDYKCGGALHANFYWVANLQVKLNGNWVLEDCVTGGCQQRHPSSGWFPYGSEQSGGGNWNVLRSIAGHSYRMRDVMNFDDGSPDIVYISPVVNP